MPKKPDVRYYPSRGAYYAQIKGKKKLLASGPDDRPDGPTYKAAFKKFWELFQESNVHVAGDTNSVRVILKKYLEHIRGRRSERTCKIRELAFNTFVDEHGDKSVGALSHHLVYEFINARRRYGSSPGKRQKDVWGESAVVSFLSSLHVAFNWARKSRLISHNPIAGIEMPLLESLGAEKVLTPDEQNRVRAAAVPLLRDVIIVLECTGCRPSELCAATAADYRADLQAFVFPARTRRRTDGYRHKTASKGRSRVIVLAGPALAVVQERMRLYPTGPLFRRKSGRPWTVEKLGKQIAKLREVVGLPDLTAYSYRHTYATRWLLAGRSIDQLAIVLGNSPEVLRKHYSHLEADRNVIRDLVTSFVAGIPG